MDLSTSKFMMVEKTFFGEFEIDGEHVELTTKMSGQELILGGKTYIWYNILANGEKKIKSKYFKPIEDILKERNLHYNFVNPLVLKTPIPPER